MDSANRKSLNGLSIVDVFKVNGQSLDNLDKISGYINDYKSAVDESSSATADYIEKLTKTSKPLADYIQNTDKANLSVEGFYASQLQQTKGFMGVREVIATYNQNSEQGIQTQTAYAKAVGQTNTNLGKYLTGLNGAKGSMTGYAGSLVKAKAATIGLSIATAAMNMAITAGISWLISKGIEGLDYLIHYQEKVMEKASEAANKAKQDAEKTKAENQQLDELIAKYKELAESENSDSSEVRAEIRDIQKEITDIVGKQADNLDLVNGKLDEEIKKLDTIQGYSLEDVIKDYDTAYRAAKKESEAYTHHDNTFSDSVLGNDYDNNVITIDYLKNNKGRNEAIKIIDKVLREGNYGTAVIGGGFKNGELDSYTKIDFDPDSSWTKRLEGLNAAIEALKQSDINIDDVQLYDELLDVRKGIKDNLDKQISAANNYLDVLTIKYSSDGQDNIKSVDDYTAYRDKLIKNINKDKTIKGIVEDNIISKSDIDKYIDDYLATVEPLSDVYNQWLTKQQPSLSEAEARRYAEESRARLQTAVDNSPKVSLDKLFDIEDDDGNTFRERIETFKSSKSELEEALNSFAMGESPYADLIDEYPELIGHTDDLDVAINNLLADLDGQMYLDFANQFGKLDTESDREQLIAYRDALIGIDSGFDISDYESKISKVKETSSTLKSALKSLNSGESLAIDFYMEFPDLLPYAKNTDVLKEKISELIAQNPKKLISELNDLKQSLNTDKEREQVKALISLLQNLGETEDEISAKAIFDNLETQCDNIIDKLEDERDVQQKNLDSLKAQKEELEEIISNYEKVADIVTKSIDDNQISDLESKKSEIEDYYNTEIEKLREENEERDRNIDLQEKQAALENARKTKVRVYSELEGWHYEQDTSAVKAAEKDLADTQNNYAIEDLEKQRDKETSAIDEQIQAWEDYKERWTEQVEQITQADNILLASKILGSDWQEKIAEKDIGVLNNFASEYGGYKNKLNNNVESEISSIEKAIKEKDDQITEWTNYKNSLSKWSDEVDTINRTYITNLKNIANDEKLTLQERLENLRSFIDEQAKLNGVDIPDGNSIGNGISALAGAKKNVVGSFANGGAVDYTGLANVHGSQSRSEVLFNSAQAKRLYELFSNNSLNELKEKLFSGIISSSKDINNISRVQKSNTNNSYSWNINGDIKADSYAEFCKYMDRYTTEAMARFKVGK